LEAIGFSREQFTDQPLLLGLTLEINILRNEVQFLKEEMAKLKNVEEQDVSLSKILAPDSPLRTGQKRALQDNDETQQRSPKFCGVREV